MARVTEREIAAAILALDAEIARGQKLIDRLEEKRRQATKTKEQRT